MHIVHRQLAAKVRASEPPLVLVCYFVHVILFAARPGEMEHLQQVAVLDGAVVFVFHRVPCSFPAHASRNSSSVICRHPFCRIVSGSLCPRLAVVQRRELRCNHRFYFILHYYSLILLFKNCLQVIIIFSYGRKSVSVKNANSRIVT